MADVLIRISEAGADLAFAADDLERDAGLRTPVLVSLFSDARLPEGAFNPGGGESSDPRGWWADLGRDRGIGSLLWVESRAKITLETIEAIRAAAAASLSWIVELGIGDLVEVVASRRGTSSAIDLEIAITRGSSTRYANLWQGVADYDLSLEGLRLQLLFR